jgi:tetratricopeptide (TPR) repeat protein
MNNISSTYTQLGKIFQEKSDLSKSEDLYKRSLSVTEEINDYYGSASTYHNMGIIAQKRLDYVVAKEWYMKSLAIKRKSFNPYGEAITYHQLGEVDRLQGYNLDAAKWYLQAMKIHQCDNDNYMITKVAKDYVLAIRTADPATQTILRQHWQEAGLDQTITLDQLEQQLNDNA